MPRSKQFHRSRPPRNSSKLELSCSCSIQYHKNTHRIEDHDLGGSKPLADTSSETTHLSKSCTYREERERDYSEKDWNMKKQKRSLPSLEFQTPLRIEQTLHQSAAIHLLLLLLSWYKQRRRGRGGNSMLGLKYCCKPVIHIVS